MEHGSTTYLLLFHYNASSHHHDAFSPKHNVPLAMFVHNSCRGVASTQINASRGIVYVHYMPVASENYGPPASQ